MIMSTCYLNAQVVAYSFSQSNGTYTEITGGTLLGTETSDDQRFLDPADLVGAGFATTGVGLPIGFNFVFNGVVYDRFGVNNNGWISLGMSSLGAAAVNMNSTSSYTPTRSTSTAVTDDLVARISGLGRDLQAQVGSTLRYELTGTAPNQVLVIQFKNYKKFGATAGTDNFNFQIRLKETSNLVEIVYGTQVNNATSSTYDVGLRASPAATASNFNSRTSLTSWSATTSSVDALGAITMNATIIPASGLTFTWTPPTCPGATGIALTSLTSSSADVTWTQPTPLPSNGYQYVITSTAGLPTGAGTPSATNMVSATGLTANTTYYVYVRSDCGSSFGNWILSGTFKTLCDQVAAFVQNFDSYPANSTSLPDCWSRAGTSANVYINTGASAPMSPSNRLYMNVSTTTSAFAIMAPVSNLQANTHRLKFKAFATSANKSMSVGYFATPGDVTSYVEIEPIQLPSTVIANTQEFTIIPSSVPAGVTQLVLNTTQPTPSATTVYIDDVKWEVNSSCVEPTALTATVITSTSATLGWTNGATEAMWDIQYGPNNFPLGTGSFVNGVTANPHILSGLTPNTVYQYYVRAVCTGPVNSSWTGPFTFKTQCIPSTAPYTEGFSNAGAIPSCWTMSGGEDWRFSNTGSGNHIGNNGTITGNTTSGGYFAWVDDSTPDFSDVTLTSPLIDASALTTPRLTFYELSNNEGFQNSTLIVEVWDGAAWNAMAQYNTNTPGGWEKKVISLSSLTITGNLQVRFIYAGDTSGFYDDIAIDDVTIEETPATPPTCASNIVATPNATCGNEATVISWDATPLADGYYLTMGTTMGGTNILNNVDIGAAPTYSYIGTFNTTYYYTISPYNASGIASSCTENTFTTVATGCYCPSVPTSNDNSGITNVQLGTTDFPTTDVTYFDHSATPVTLPQGLNTNVQISFATGYTYNTYMWIDFNDNYIFDASELVYTGESLAPNPTVLNASFVMSATAALGTHRMRIVTADALTTANPCYSGSYGITLDFSVNIIVSSCTPASATATIVPDCANNQYSVNVNVTNLGSGSPVLSYGTTTLPITTTGVVTAGPFTSGSSNALTILHGSDTTCDLPLGNFTYACPPVNDECANPTVLTPGGVFATNQVTGTNVAATSSTQTDPTCASYQGGDVWYSAVVPASGSLTFEVNPTTGGLTDTGGAVYSGTCSSLTEIACNDSSSATGDHPLIIVTGQAPGSVLYFRVWEYGNNAFGTFLVSAYDGSLSASSFDNASFVAYPNPVKDVLNLSYSSEITSVKVINLLGQEVISRKVNNTTSQIDMTSLTAGAYIVNVTVGDVVKTIKVIKQ